MSLSYKHVFFDLDNTLMRSRTEMFPEHRPIFRKLAEHIDVVVVSGAKESQMRTQVTPEHDGLYYKLAQYGNFAAHKDGSVLWEEKLNTEQTDAVVRFVEKVQKELNFIVKDEADLVDHKGCQIGYSLIGHHEDTDKKYAFDPGSVKRRAILTRYANDVADLRALGVDVSPGGTTCIDFFLAGRHKGFNIDRLIRKLGWHKDECLYIGDELEPGRNDETVIGVIPTKPVKDCHETYRYVASLL